MTNGNLEHQDEQAGELLSGVLSDARDLAVAEVDKLKAEAITKIKGVGQDIKLASVGMLILTVAAMLLGISLALGLVELGLAPWLGFGVVAVVCALIGVVFLKHHMSDKPDDPATVH